MAVVSSMPVLEGRVRAAAAAVAMENGGGRRDGGLEEESSPPPAVVPIGEEMVFVAVGKEVKENKETVLWAVRNSGGKKICILHVHQPAQMIPMPMGAKFHASKLKPGEVRQYRQQEQEKMQEILDTYLCICARERVHAEKRFIEMDDIEKGILELVSKHGITKLVMGAAANNHYSKRMREPKSKKAIFVGREAQLSCHISFVCKGILVCTREATSDGTGAWVTPPSPIFSPSTSTGLFIQSNIRSVSHGQGGAMNRLTNPVLNFLTRSRSENFATGRVVELPLQETRTLSAPHCPFSVEGSGDQWEDMSRSISQGSMGSAWSTSEEDGSSPSVSMERDAESEGSVLSPVNELEEDGHFTSPSNVEEEEHIDDQQVYKQLEQAMTEVEICKRVALEELVERQKAEKDAIKAKLKAKESERLYTNEMKQRREMEELLAREKKELEKVKMQVQEALEELKRASERQSALEIQVTNAKELEEKMLEAQQLLKTLQRECDELQRERDEAIREAEELQRRNEEASTSLHRLPDFSEFSSLEVEEATKGFNPSLKIGEGGYGIVYRGILRHTPVAIKVLHPDSLQGQSEFQQEVDVLSRVRHPNLVTLIGTCPEAWSLVYEYLPNGSLEDRLVCKDNTPPLSWQTRTHIIADVCSALIFLHSNKPQGVVHGDLKPANILLDANYVSKLGDFGICRLITQNSAMTLCCVTDPKGTFMYMDPEFLTTGELTPRSDVYSFGIIILRLLTGKPALGIVKEVQQALDAGNLHGILDELAGDWPFVQAKQLAQLGLKCCEMNRRSRPDLESEVWRLLEPMKALSGLASSFRLLPTDPSRVPAYFICPIFLEIMQDPQVAADGFTYEAEAFRGWLENGHETSPVTNGRLAHNELIPNRALKSAIQEWLQQL